MSVLKAPVEDSIVVAEGAENVLQILLESRPLRRVVHHLGRGAAAPVSPFVYAGLGTGLGAKFALFASVGAECEGYLEGMMVWINRIQWPDVI